MVLEREAPVSFFAMGQEAWRHVATWPPPKLGRHVLHLSPGGDLSLDPRVCLGCCVRRFVWGCAVIDSKTSWLRGMEVENSAASSLAAAAAAAAARPSRHQALPFILRTRFRSASVFGNAMPRRSTRIIFRLGLRRCRVRYPPLVGMPLSHTTRGDQGHSMLR